MTKTDQIIKAAQACKMQLLIMQPAAQAVLGILNPGEIRPGPVALQSSIENCEVSLRR